MRATPFIETAPNPGCHRPLRAQAREVLSASIQQDASLNCPRVAQLCKVPQMNTAGPAEES